MTQLVRKYSAFALAAALLLSPGTSRAEMPAEIAVKDEAKIAELHAEGAQIYECKADASGKLSWQFREPVASLILDGKTVGRHYAGPNWELEDGSAVVAKAAGRAPGTTPQDIPWLKLNVVSERGSGKLTGVTTVQRINTKGGTAEGSCPQAGGFMSVPYSADYIFLKKS